MANILDPDLPFQSFTAFFLHGAQQLHNFYRTLKKSTCRLVKQKMIMKKDLMKPSGVCSDQWSSIPNMNYKSWALNGDLTISVISMSVRRYTVA